MDKNIQKRIASAIDELCNGNRSEFCRRIGRKVDAVKDIIGGRNTAPSYDLIYAILSSDLGISPTWLILGIGPMMEDLPSTNEVEVPRSNVSTHNEIHHNNTVNINYGALKETIIEAIREANRQ